LGGTSLPAPTTNLLAPASAPEHLICALAREDDVVAGAGQIADSALLLPEYREVGERAFWRW
jgi:hypothetical protein